MYTPSCFRILDSANSSIDLKLKEAFYISKNKPDLNKQLHHSSIGNGGSDAVLQTAPEKAATPYTTILIFSSSAAQEITK